MTDVPAHRVRAELEELRQERSQLLASLDADGPKDTADQADEITRGDELLRISNRIDELERMLRYGDDPAAVAYLPIGTRATLRYADGDTEQVEVGYMAGEADGVTAITPDSPLAAALRDSTAGTQVSWDAPVGTATAELVSIERP